jgi:hypothetical protein
MLTCPEPRPTEPAREASSHYPCDRAARCLVAGPYCLHGSSLSCDAGSSRCIPSPPFPDRSRCSGSLPARHRRLAKPPQQHLPPQGRAMVRADKTRGIRVQARSRRRRRSRNAERPVTALARHIIGPAIAYNYNTAYNRKTPISKEHLPCIIR